MTITKITKLTLRIEPGRNETFLSLPRHENRMPCKEPKRGCD